MSPSQLLALIANKEGTQIEFKRLQESFSLRDRILREVMLYMIIHREYSSAFPTSFTILRDTIVTENPQKTSQKTTQIILEMIQENPEIHIEELAEACGLTRGHLRKFLQDWFLKKNLHLDTGEICEFGGTRLSRF